MKRLIYLIYIVFFVLTAATFYVAYHVYDGLLEEGYYQKAADYFHEKEKEEGVIVEVPTVLKTGDNQLSIKITRGGRPIKGGEIILRVMGMKEKEGERVVHLRETSPGVFTGMVRVEKRGRKILRMLWSDSERKIERRWFVEVN